MSKFKGTVDDLIDRMKRKAPATLDLICADTEDEFDTAFDVLLEQAIMQLEASKKDFASLGENALTAILASALRMPGLGVQLEAKSNGHVDITIEADGCFPAFKKLGEAKIANGPSYHIKGLHQLINRYTTGRESRGMVIAYFRKENIRALMEDVQKEMNDSLPCAQQGCTKDHALEWAFISTHKHSSGEDVDVVHVACNLHCE